MNVVIPDDYQNAVPQLHCFRKLDGHSVTVFHDTVRDLDTLVERFAPAEALVLIRERTPIGEALLARLPELRLISQTGGGTAHIDHEACRRHGVAVSAGSGSPEAPAELTWGLILASMRHIPREIAAMRAGHWQTALGTGLHGRILGIFGYGKIGRLVAGYGRAFGMHVLVWGRARSLTQARNDGFETARSQADLFQRSDVLSLHLKLNAGTEAIVSRSDLARMKPTALLVNTSRAGLIAPGALHEALIAGRPGFGAVDVYEEEPAADHPLLQLPNVLCTPHIGYVERDHYEAYFGVAFDQVNAFAAGEPFGLVSPAANHRAGPRDTAPANHDM